MPREALAWGPVTHLTVALGTLEKLLLLKPSLYLFLSRYLADYLYGCLSSDIVLGKRFQRVNKQRHTWEGGFRLLSEAATPSQKAFAYGFLCHLAADTVSHNRYVPSRILLSFSSRTLNHTYWELRFDAMMDQQLWDVAKLVIRHAQKRNAPLLKEFLEKTAISFSTSRRIFNGYLSLGAFDRWQRFIRYFSNRSRWVLPEEQVKEYRNQALGAAVDLFTLGEKAPCLSVDPCGKEALAMAKKMRGKLRSRARAVTLASTFESLTERVALPPLRFLKMKGKAAKIRLANNHSR